MENLQNLDNKIYSELCTSSSDGENLNLESPNKLESAQEEKALIENIVKEKRDSRVSRFVRMFNRRDTGTTESGERSSVRKSQSRVWGMCLQVQSPNVEGEADKDFLHKRCEIASIKSEPLIDGSFSDKDSSFEANSDRGRSSSSFNDIEAASQESLDYIICDNRHEKNNIKLTAEEQNKNLLRNGGGRRSFDKPRRTAKSLAKRSNTLDDVDDYTNKYSRSSKTLPATPTSGVTGLGQDSNASHPFYRRFYSHCMILPMMKRKRQTAKKCIEHKNSDTIIDTDPQSTAAVCQHEDNVVNVNTELKEVLTARASIKRYEEIEDSPQKNSCY